MNQLTIDNISNLDFQKGNGLLPVIAQNMHSGEVLMLAYANESSLVHTLKSGNLTFYSRSKKRLWTKGETSGNFLKVDHLKYDCDQDTILALVNPIGPACHTGNRTCFGNEQESFDFLTVLQGIITDRKKKPLKGSYTTSLFNSGIEKIAQKVGEEGVETVIAALAQTENDLVNESADLIYHLLVLLTARDLDLALVVSRLKERHLK